MNDFNHLRAHVFRNSTESAPLQANNGAESLRIAEQSGYPLTHYFEG